MIGWGSGKYAINFVTYLFYCYRPPLPVRNCCTTLDWVGPVVLERAGAPAGRGRRRPSCFASLQYHVGEGGHCWLAGRLRSGVQNPNCRESWVNAGHCSKLGSRWECSRWVEGGGEEVEPVCLRHWEERSCACRALSRPWCWYVSPCASGSLLGGSMLHWCGSCPHHHHACCSSSSF